MVFLDMHPLNQPEVMIGNCADKFNDAGELTDESTKDHISKQLHKLVEWSKKLAAG
jgi:chromate reductase